MSSVADLERPERIAIGGVRDVVAYTGCVTYLTCDDAIGRACIANDPLLAVSHNPCTNAFLGQLWTRVMRHNRRGGVGLVWPGASPAHHHFTHGRTAADGIDA